MAPGPSREAEPPEGETSGSVLSDARTVLVLMHDATRGGNLLRVLQHRGLPTLQAETTAQALYWMRRQPPALVVIDLAARGSRLLLVQLRGEELSVMAVGDDPESRAWALETGCLRASAPPADPDELALEVAAAVRTGRATRRGRIAAGPLVVDLSGGLLIWHDRAIPASPLLVDLAACLASRAGRLVTTRELIGDVWAEPWGKPWVRPEKVHQAVWRLRELLGETRHSTFLLGRRGHGYGIFPESEAGFEAPRA